MATRVATPTSTSSSTPSDLIALAQAVGAWATEVTPHAGRLGAYQAVLPGLPALGMSVRRLSEDHRDLAEFLSKTATAFAKADLRGRLSRVDNDVERWRLRTTDPRLARMAIKARGRLLTFDPQRDGRVVEFSGDLATADHVAVFVPGMANDITNYNSTKTKALNLLREMQAVAKPGERVAVVVWLGYDTPDLTPVRVFLEAARSNKAVAGAKVLDRDLDFLRGLNPGTHITVVGHSYGSLVVGKAMRRGIEADDAVVVGSPGMGVRDRQDLGSAHTTLWAGHRAMFDPVSFAPRLGEDPSAHGFHANRFRTAGSSGHSDYFNPGSVALRNIALIATGAQPTAGQDPAPTPRPKPRTRPKRQTRTTKA